jgi:hypothetical protein
LKELMADQITIRRLAARAGISGDELIASAGRPGFGEEGEVRLDARIDEMLDAAETADYRADQADDMATVLLHAQADELRALARLFLRRMAASAKSEQS